LKIILRPKQPEYGDIFICFLVNLLNNETKSFVQEVFTVLTPELAEEIVRETMNRLHRNINIMDEAGFIIASGDSSRLGQLHEAAAEAIRINKALVINEENLCRWKGVHIGVNIPVQFLDRVIGAIGITGKPDEVEPFGNLVKMTTELMIKQNYLRLQDDWQQMTVNLIIEELLEFEPTEFFKIEQRLQALGIQFTAPYQVILVAALARPQIRGETDLLQTVKNIFGREEALVSFFSPHKVTVISMGLKSDQVHKKLLHLRKQLDHKDGKFVIATSSPIHQWESIRVAYQEAQLTLRFGDSQAEPVIYFSSVETKALVHEIPKRHQDRLVSKFSASWNKKTKQTLESYFENNLNISKTVRKLGIHRNTMIYRLEKIKQDTGYDPQNFRDAMLLQFVLWLKEADHHKNSPI
jgi:carbohydrate diacid regulator